MVQQKNLILLLVQADDRTLWPCVSLVVDLIADCQADVLRPVIDQITSLHETVHELLAVAAIHRIRIPETHPRPKNSSYHQHDRLFFVVPYVVRHPDVLNSLIGLLFSTSTNAPRVIPVAIVAVFQFEGDRRLKA